MENCEASCKQTAEKTIKINFIDRIIGRTMNEKLNTFILLIISKLPIVS